MRIFASTRCDCYLCRLPEAGRDGVERERELGEILHAQKGAMRLIGPNCLGIIDTHSLVNASFAVGTPPKGPMAFMSQSGALGTAVLDWAMAGQLGLSKFVSLGQADVNEIDLLLAWAGSPQISKCHPDLLRRTERREPFY